MRGILGDKRAADLKVCKKVFESSVSLSLTELKKPDQKLKTKQRKALVSLVIQKIDVLAVLVGAANQKSDRNGFCQMCVSPE